MDRSRHVLSYNLELPCGCIVYVSCHPVTRLAYTRVIQIRSQSCSRRRHEVGARLFLWEILPDRTHRARPVWTDEYEVIARDSAGSARLDALPRS